MVRVVVPLILPRYVLLRTRRQAVSVSDGCLDNWTNNTNGPQQRLTDDGNATIPSAGGHAGARRPHSGQWVVSLDAAQTGRTVETAAHVQQPVAGAYAQAAPFCAQWRDRWPLVDIRIVALGRRQVHDTVVPVTYWRTLRPSRGENAVAERQCFRSVRETVNAYRLSFRKNGVFRIIAWARRETKFKRI